MIIRESKVGQRVQVGNMFVKYNGRDYQIEDEKGKEIYQSGISTDTEAEEIAKEMQDMKVESKSVLKEGYYDVRIQDLHSVIEKLEELVNEMEDLNISEISPSPNTYGLYNFISIGGKGFIDLDDISQYIPDEDEWDEDEDFDEEDL